MYTITSHDVDYTGEFLSTYSVDEMKRELISRGSHFFEKTTMQWFGTRSLEMVGGVVMVGLDTKAPELDGRYWARVFDTEGRATRVASAADRRTVLRAARHIATAIRDLPR